MRRGVERESAGDAGIAEVSIPRAIRPGVSGPQRFESTTFDNFDNANYKTTARATAELPEAP